MYDRLLYSAIQLFSRSFWHHEGISWILAITIFIFYGQCLDTEIRFRDSYIKIEQDDTLVYKHIYQNKGILVNIFNFHVF